MTRPLGAPPIADQLDSPARDDWHRHRGSQIQADKNREVRCGAPGDGLKTKQKTPPCEGGVFVSMRSSRAYARSSLNSPGS